MSSLRGFLFRLGSLVRRRRIEGDLGEEIEAHLRMAVEARVSEGMDPQEARFSALREFGGVEQVKEAYRDERGLPWLERLSQDVRFSVRSLARNPSFTVLTLATLALGISLNTTAFSFVSRIGFRQLPFGDPKGLVELFRTDTKNAWFGSHAPGDLFDAKEQNTVFSHFAIVDTPDYSLATGSEPAQRISGQAVGGDYFPMLGVAPLYGRTFGPAEDAPGKSDVIVLSYAFWVSHFGADRSVLGRRLRLDGAPVTVIGIMPESFEFTQLFGRHDIWKPISMEGPARRARDGHWLRAVARLKPGVSIQEASSNLNLIASRLAKDYPVTNAGSGYALSPLGVPPNGGGRGMLYFILALALAVLLIACANIANLQLARSSGRAREFGIRLALGSTRRRLVRQMIVESLILALAGGLIGVLVAWAFNRRLAMALGPLMQDPGFSMPIDLRVLGAAFLASVATGVFFGALPAWLASDINLSAGLRMSGPAVTSSRSRHRMRRLLVIAELALTLTVLAGSLTLVDGEKRFTMQPIGWDASRMAVARVALPARTYPGPENCAAFYRAILREMRALPGVTEALVCDILPVGGFYNAHPMAPESAAKQGNAQAPGCDVNTVTPGYFGALRMKLLMGRDFSEADRIGSPQVAIVSESLARRFWPGEPPLGKRMRATDSEKPEWLEVVGVVNTIAFNSQGNTSDMLQYYRPIAQTGGNYMSIAARTTGNPESLVESLRQAVFRVDPDQAVYEATTAEEMMSRDQRFNAIFEKGLGVLDVAGLLLSALGLYGVISILVLERTAEMGVRMALGARVSQVVLFVVRQGAQMAAVGIAIGMVGGWVAAKLVTASMPGTAPDLLLIAGSGFVLVLVALAASFAPARRAARIDPIVALRTE